MRQLLLFTLLPVGIFAQTLGPFGNNMHSAYVHDAIVFNNQLLFGSSGGRINGVPTNGVAIYDGTTTSTLPGAGSTSAFTIINNELYMAGFYPNGEAVLKWDGSSLTPLGLSSNGSYIFDIVEYNGDIYVGGQFNVGGTYYALAKYDGLSWSYLATVSNNQESCFTLEVKNNLLFVGGAFTSIDGTVVNGIASYNSTTWDNLLGGPANGDSAIVRGIINSGTGIIATGRALRPQPALMATWSGSNWTQNNFPEFNNFITVRSFNHLGINFISTDYPQFAFDSLEFGSLYIYANNNLTALVDTLFKDEEYIPVGPEMVRGIIYFNNEWILYGGFRKANRSGPAYNGLAVISGILSNPKFDETTEFSLAPNPTNDYLNLTEVRVNTPFQIIDKTGKVVLSGHCQQHVDVRHLPPGNYVLSLGEGDEIQRHKFIKIE